MTNHRAVEVNGRTYKWPARPVVVVCIDGSEPAYIEQAVTGGHMPWTARIVGGEGADLRVDCVVPSFTNPNNLSIVTGVAPAEHGICGNFYYDREADREVMMNQPQLLRVPTLFEKFQRDGAQIAVVTAKDKLRLLLGKGLEYGAGGAICFSSEKADEATLASNGIEAVIARVGMPVPDVYSAELSEFVFAAGVDILRTERPDIMYLSTTDYIQHKHAPGSEGANSFYAMMDAYWAELDALGAVVALTADHGMNAKHDADGRPDVIYLQDLLDQRIGLDRARVILPITDPYVVHHGALGSFATVYLPNTVSAEAVAAELRSVDGIETVLSNANGCRQFELAPDRMGDLIVVSERQKVLGTTAARHDLSGLDAPLRSHGGSSEQRVPLVCSRPVTGLDTGRRLRNFDVYDIALNHVA